MTLLFDAILVVAAFARCENVAHFGFERRFVGDLRFGGSGICSKRFELAFKIGLVFPDFRCRRAVFAGFSRFREQRRDIFGNGLIKRKRFLDFR